MVVRINLFLLLFILSSCGAYKSPIANHTDCSGMLDVDSDGDGIPDKFDRCGDTQGGVAVTVWGCPLDTDGDGVPDYKDYQLITPTECQPVDSLGIGKCPCPCEKLRVICDFQFTSEWIGFSYLSYKLDSTAFKSIERFANQMRNNPNFPIQIKGYHGMGENTSCASWQASWSRVFEIRQYLINELGIDADRIVMRPGEIGQPYLIELTGLDKNDKAETRGKIIPPGFPGFIDEKNKRILDYKN